MHFSEITTEKEVQAREAVPKYFAEYKKRIELPVYRPVKAQVVCDRGDRLRIETDVYYRTADEFRGQHVVIVGGGISAIQLLDEISRVTSTTWVARRPPEFREGPFDENAGRAAVLREE